MIGPGEIFTLLFVTLGPERVSREFGQVTRGLSPAARRDIALRVFVLSLFVLLAGGSVGRFFAIHWKLSIPALLIATGVIFFLVALAVVREPYERRPTSPPPPLPSQPTAAALQITFPTVVTPYGIAALIVLLAATQDTVRMEMIFGLAAGMMVINLVAMLLSRADSDGLVALGLRLVGVVLAVLQVALAVQIFIVGLERLGVLKQ